MCTRAVSALGHMMEERGFATVAIALARPQVQAVRPPRALWVPFQLGRPLGEPEDVAFQRRVLMGALGMLERTDGPVILDDFADDPPGWTDQPGWEPPFVSGEPLAADPAGVAGQWAAELARLRPSWEAAQRRFGRTTVGLSGQEPGAWPGFVGQVLGGGQPVVPPHPTAALSVRYLCDDIRAMYSEAAQASGAAPASRQIDGWYWRSTVAGRVVIALRALAVASGDEATRTVGTRFMVPAVFLPAAKA